MLIAARARLDEASEPGHVEREPAYKERRSTGAGFHRSGPATPMPGKHDDFTALHASRGIGDDQAPLILRGLVVVLATTPLPLLLLAGYSRGLPL